MFTPDALGQIVSDKSGYYIFEGRIDSCDHKKQRYRVSWCVDPHKLKYRRSWVKADRIAFKPAFEQYIQDKYVHLSGASSKPKTK